MELPALERWSKQDAQGLFWTQDPMIRLFRVSVPASVLFLVPFDSILLFGLYTLGTYLGFTDDAEYYLFEEGGFGRIAVVVATIQLGLYFQDLYEEIVPRSRVFLIQQLCTVLGAAFLIQAVFGYGPWSIQLHKWAMVDGSILTLVVLPIWRIGYRELVRRALPTEKILFLGSSGIVREIAKRLSDRPELGLSVLGYIDDQDKIAGDFPALRLGCLADLAGIVRHTRAVRIVVATSDSPGWFPIEALLELRLAGIDIDEATAFYEAVMGKVSIADLRPWQLVFSREMGPPPRYLQLQNAYSLMLGIVVLLVSLPIMALIAILVKISSPGPALYRQTRVGLRGAPFQLYKFRSTYADAEARSGAVWAAKSDPRITPVGRWLRKLRVDELPQFINVVRGEMAVVGPRPERPEFCRIQEEKIPYYRQRYSVKPGITGWAQINFPYAESIEDSVAQLEYDFYYIKHLAPSLDAYIFFHTLKVMLLSSGSR